MGTKIRRVGGYLVLQTVYATLCQGCVFKIHPLMLTTYCLRNQKCDECGRVSDLAMVKLNKEMEIRR